MLLVVWNFALGRLEFALGRLKFALGRLKFALGRLEVCSWSLGSLLLVAWVCSCAFGRLGGLGTPETFDLHTVQHFGDASHSEKHFTLIFT